MAKNATLNVKIEPEIVRGLKELARKQGRTMGDMVREAVVSCYQPHLSGLNQSQRRALQAYQGGYISLGKLAGAMGMHILEMREWLNDHGIGQNSCYGEEDVPNA